jgi:DnaJ-class molecular chaperone
MSQEYGIPKYTCPDCNGEGVVPSVYDVEDMTELCPKCGGRGYFMNPDMERSQDGEV